MTPETKKEAEALADDVMRIVQRVAGRRLFQAIKFLYEEEIDPLRREIAALREALEPFASLAEYIDDHALQKKGRFETASVAMESLRNARTALAKARGEA